MGRENGRAGASVRCALLLCFALTFSAAAWAADYSKTIPWNNGQFDSIAVTLHFTAANRSRQVEVKAADGYKFKSDFTVTSPTPFPTSDITITGHMGTTGLTSAVITFNWMAAAPDKEIDVTLHNVLVPAGGGGGGGTPPEKPFDLVSTLAFVYARFETSGGTVMTNLVACCGNTNTVVGKLILGNGKVPDTTSTLQLVVPAELGSVNPTAATAINGQGKVPFQVIASTNAGGPQNITLKNPTLKDQGTAVNLHAADTNIPMTDVIVDLVIDGIAEEEKVSPGAVVVRNYDNNNAPRKMLILFAQPSSWTNNLLFTRNNTKVRIFTARTNGTEVTFNGMDNKFLTTTLPTNLWVEGATASDSTNDVELVLTPESPSTCPDKVRFTVLWVAITGKFSSAESVSDDNAAKNAYLAITAPSRATLGPGQFIDHMGWGAEFIGNVKPTNFVLQIMMQRDAQAKLYTNGTYLADSKSFSNTIPSGNDNSLDTFRDDDPRPGGRIYDLDTPGIRTDPPRPPSEVLRLRANFKAFAVFEDTRCSEVFKWYCKVSYTNSGASASGTATSYGNNTMTDTNQSWTVDTWKNGTVLLWSPILGENYRVISGNTATSVTVTANWTFESGHTVFYVINGTNTWVPVNDVTDDNDARDGGPIPLSWDLK